MLLIALFFCFAGHSEERAFSGKVMNKDGKGIPYTAIFMHNTGIGYYTDSNGAFHFKYDTDCNEIVQFRCIGYRTKQIYISELFPDSVSVSLDREDIRLDPVVVSWGKEKTETGVLGNTGAKKFREGCSNCQRGVYGSFEDEYGVFLKADSQRQGILKDVYVYITKDGLPQSSFRVHVYNVDGKKFAPLNDITDSNVVVHGQKGNEWVRVDLSNKKIPVKGGVFITVEWVTGHYYYPKSWSKEILYTRAQVVGMAREYCKQAMISVHRKVYDNAWNVDICQPGEGRKVMSTSIYATYTFASNDTYVSN